MDPRSERGRRDQAMEGMRCRKEEEEEEEVLACTVLYTVMVCSSVLVDTDVFELHSPEWS